MSNSFKGADISENGIGAVIAGEGSTADFSDATISKNIGHGVIVDIHANTKFNGAIIRQNGGIGVLEIDTRLMQVLGLPLDTDIIKLQELLLELKSQPEEKRKGIITSSFLAPVIATAANSTTLIMGILNLASQVN